MGFREIPPYRQNPHEDVIYLKLSLATPYSCAERS